MTDDGRKRLRQLYIGIGLVGLVGLVALYNLIGYLFFRFQSGWEDLGADPTYLGRYGGVVGRLLPLAFGVVVIISIVLIIYLLSKEEQVRMTKKARLACPRCNREIEADWSVCPYCREDRLLAQEGTDEV